MPVLILTRPMAASRRFLEEVEAAMGRPVSHVISPVMKIVPIAVDDLADPVTGVVFTSENAVLQAERFGFAPGLPAWCVGDRTADVARREGFEARSAGGDAEALIALVLSARPDGPLIHLHGENTRGDVAQRLTEGGVPCQALAVYGQVPTRLTEQARETFAGDQQIVLPLFSPRSAAILAGMGGLTAPIHVIAISSAVAEEASVFAPRSLTTADKPTAAAMVAATTRRIRSLIQG